MNRNSNTYFSSAPARVDLPRSVIMRNQEHKTTFNTGDLIPFYVDEVLPGSTHSIDTAMVVRMQTPIAPIMDDLFLDTYFFFVPNRLTWEHWQEFCGENRTDAWVQKVEYTIPQLKSPATTGWTKGTIADYMGIPIGVPNLSVNALPFRAYALIANEFFRSQDLTDPLNIPVNDSTQTGTNGNEYINDVANGGMPFKAAKTHDYFSSAQPAPQKALEPVSISLGAIDGTAPVVGNGKAIGFDYGNTSNVGVISSKQGNALYGTFANNSIPDAGGSSQGSGTSTTTLYNLGLSKDGDLSNVITDLSGLASETLITINQLRQAFQVQKFYEREAIGGSRYVEILKSMFGVTSPDSRLQRPEYLGGKRIPIAINQVLQTSSTDETSPQGNTAAYSLTTDYQQSFTKSFVEHGYIIGLAVVRYNHTYQQGIERMWSRKSRFDFYWPLFSNLGAQAILNKEIYAQGSEILNSDTGEAYDDEVFGYQEAWAEYRYKPNRTSGEMRSTYSTPLDMWHLGDDYDSLPALSDSWIREDGQTVDRVIAVSESLADQFLADFYVKNKTTQPMPVYSIPGLIDHH